MIPHNYFLYGTLDITKIKTTHNNANPTSRHFLPARTERDRKEITGRIRDTSRASAYEACRACQNRQNRDEINAIG